MYISLSIYANYPASISRPVITRSNVTARPGETDFGDCDLIATQCHCGSPPGVNDG